MLFIITMTVLVVLLYLAATDVISIKKHKRRIPVKKEMDGYTQQMYDVIVDQLLNEEERKEFLDAINSMPVDTDIICEVKGWVFKFFSYRYNRKYTIELLGRQRRD